MEEQNIVSDFGYIFLFIAAGIIFVFGGLMASMLLRPNRPNPEKLTTYESGEDPVGNAWGRFNIRFYIVALMFILFEIEIIFLFPWATVFGQKELIDATEGTWGWFALFEAIIFVGILALGLAYAWRKGFINWVKPKPQTAEFESPVPEDLYNKVNETYQ
ncbi:NADH-quinone oxidoreductase subunit A [Sediminitomix flava]|uniref:NADH-quinone oxidoreductase subunit A n=1 Tax=Sediminitomix flava TaxID=379075 RepID=A0A315YXG1_SEDFL|nr:NADH-quinone oxidoreductase subunit A [Sediminitomix flava]PWJ34167.1 NADH dehydrogenase subunit A [Sediminitomix flava]